MPAHIFIQGDKFTNTGDIVQWITSRTGWTVTRDSDLVKRAEDRFGMGADQIEHSLCRGSQSTGRAAQQQKKAVAYLKSTLAETLYTEAGILCGTAGHLVPPKMPHVLRVLVTAGTDDRIRRATLERQLPEKEARRQIEKADYRSFQWFRNLTGSDGLHAATYDVVVPTDVLDTEAAARLILEYLSEKANTKPEAVAKALDDFALGARVQLAMVEKGYDVTAVAKDGRVRLTVERRVLFLEKMSEKLRRTVKAVPHVAAVEIVVGKNYHQTDIYRRTRFELAPAMAMESYAKRRRYLHQSAVDSLPVEFRQRPERPEQTVGLVRPLTL